MATFAVALAPGLLVLSAGRIGRLLCRLTLSRAEMRRQPKASQLREQQITISAWRKVSANDSNLLEPNGDRLAVRHHPDPHSLAKRVTEPAR
jgi:hypothetical protein